jgi:hypothetical protein
MAVGGQASGEVQADTGGRAGDKCGGHVQPSHGHADWFTLMLGSQNTGKLTELAMKHIW